MMIANPDCLGFAKEFKLATKIARIVIKKNFILFNVMG
jgi:hypothetical protein